MTAPRDAGTIGCAVRPAGGASVRGVVAAVFRHSALIEADGAFVVLGDRTVCPHPHAVTLRRPFRLPALGAPLVLGEQELVIPGVLRLALDELREFTPLRHARSVAPPDRVRRALAAARRRVGELPPRGGFEALLSTARARPLDDMSGAVVRVALERTNRVRAALRSRDRAALVDACARLAGLGQGLTPSGDDYVAGLAAALRFHAASREAPLCAELLERVAASVAARTSGYSGFLVRCAARGFVSMPVAAWLDAVMGGRLEEVPAATEAVVEVGHSSGVDALAGMVHALEVAHEERRWTC